MSYYHLPTDTARGPGRLETKLSDGNLLGPPDTGWTDVLAALCGFVPIVDAARPADTASVTYDRSVALVAGVPTVVWTSRPKSAGELSADTQAANGSTIRTQADTARAANATFLALASPTTAQTLAQVKALTRQNNGLIRLALGLLDGTT